MAFNDLVRKSGKGLDVSKELVIALEVNLGGTCGTQYFADKNVNIEGTYYDGRILSTNSVNRRIFPDVGSYEISELETQLANHDNEFYQPKWVRWSQGNPAKLKIAFHGTRDLQQADFATRYNGILQNMKYDSTKKTTEMTFEDRTQKLLRKLLPDQLVRDDDFPGRDTTNTLVGTPLPFIYGGFFENLGGAPNYFVSVPGIVVGTYMEGTTKLAFADHDAYLSWPSYFFQDGKNIAGTYIFYKNGTMATHGTRPIAYMDLNHDPGTSIISMYLVGKVDGALDLYNFSPFIRDILRRANLTEPDEIGTFSFDKAREMEFVHTGGTWGRGHIYLDKQKTIKEILEDFCYQANYMLYFDSQGRANIKPYFYTSAGTSDYHSYGYTEEGTREFDKDDFLKFQANKDTSHVINQTQTIYHYCPYGDFFSYLGQVDHKASQKRLGYTRTRKTEAYWLYGTGGHYRQDWARIARFRYPLYKANFQLPMSALPLELANYVQITHSEVPNEYGTQGWQQKQMEIVSIEEDYNNAIINCEAWEWGLQIPPWNLKTWLSLAEGEGTHLYHEFREYYDAIAANQKNWSTAGTESSYWDNKVGNDYVLTFDGASQFACGNKLTTSGWGWDSGNWKQGVKGAVIKPDNLSSKMCIMSCNRLGTNGWELGIDTDGSIYYSIANTYDGEVTKNSPANVISGPGTWQAIHAGHTRRGTTDDIWCNFYLNGTQSGTLVEMSKHIMNVSLQPAGIGAANLGTWADVDPNGGTISGCRYFDGQKGDVVFYIDGTRSAADMEKLFNGLRGRYGL